MSIASGSFSLEGFQLSNIITSFQTSHQQASHWHGYYLAYIILNILWEMSPKFPSEILAVAVRALVQGLPFQWTTVFFWIRPNQHAKPLSQKLSKCIGSGIRTFTNQERPTLVPIPNETLVGLNRRRYYNWIDGFKGLRLVLVQWGKWIIIIIRIQIGRASCRERVCSTV